MRRMPSPRPAMTVEDYIIWLHLAQNASVEEIQAAIHRNYAIAYQRGWIEDLLR